MHVGVEVGGVRTERLDRDHETRRRVVAIEDRADARDDRVTSRAGEQAEQAPLALEQPAQDARNRFPPPPPIAVSTGGSGGTGIAGALRRIRLPVREPAFDLVGELREIVESRRQVLVYATDVDVEVAVNENVSEATQTAQLRTEIRTDHPLLAQAPEDIFIVRCVEVERSREGAVATAPARRPSPRAARD